MMLRSFRLHWKNLFTQKYPSKTEGFKGKHFFWVPSTRRELVRHFWLDLNIDGLNEQTYKDHEYVLFKLIFPTYSDLINPNKPKNDNLQTHGIAIPNTHFAKCSVMKKVFGSAPNNLNLKEFFKNSTIKMLWRNNFFTSDTMRTKIVTKIPA